jgi:plasmid stabilization system protein ParE
MDKVVWTDTAIQDLNDIGDYIAKDSERYAKKLMMPIHQLCVEFR